MPVEVFEFDEKREREIKDLATFIGSLCSDGKEYNLEELFLRIFKDPNFPNQPIVSETTHRENFTLALLFVDKNKFKVNETIIKLKS